MSIHKFLQHLFLADSGVSMTLCPAFLARKQTHTAFCAAVRGHRKGKNTARFHRYPLHWPGTEGGPWCIIYTSYKMKHIDWDNYIHCNYLYLKNETDSSEMNK